VHVFHLAPGAFNVSLPPPAARNASTFPGTPDGGGLAHSFALFRAPDDDPEAGPGVPPRYDEGTKRNGAAHGTVELRVKVRPADPQAAPAHLHSPRRPAAPPLTQPSPGRGRRRRRIGFTTARPRCPVRPHARCPRPALPSRAAAPQAWAG